MSSRVGRLHRGPDFRCLHNGQHSFNRDHKSKGFHLRFPQWQQTGGGGSFKPRETATAVSTTGLLPISSTAGVSLAHASLASGTVYRPLPSMTHIEVKHNGTHSYVSNVRWLPGRRLNSGQSPSRRVIITEMFSSFVSTTHPFTTGMLSIVSTTSDCFFSCSSVSYWEAVPATSCCLPGTEAYMKQDIMHRYL